MSDETRIKHFTCKNSDGETCHGIEFRRAHNWITSVTFDANGHFAADTCFTDFHYIDEPQWVKGPPPGDGWYNVIDKRERAWAGHYEHQILTTATGFIGPHDIAKHLPIPFPDLPKPTLEEELVDNVLADFHMSKAAEARATLERSISRTLKQHGIEGGAT